MENEPWRNGHDAADVSVKTLLLYQRPVPLNRETHRDLRVQSTEGDFSFARTTNSIPVAGEEFPEACRHYPIVFAGDDPAISVPAVVLGLRDEQNLFVDSDGTWPTGYIPAFVRRYPFVLAEQEGSEDFTVCVDEAFPGFSTDEGEPLFASDGSHGAFLERAIEFLSHFQGQMQRTRDFVTRLNELELLQGRSIEARPHEGETLALRGFYVIDEEKLQALTDAALRQLMAKQELAWVYAHLISLRSVGALSKRLESKNDTVQKPSSDKTHKSHTAVADEEADAVHVSQH